MLPNMNIKRAGCVAAIAGNVIVVMGGKSEKGEYLNSVECFNFDRYVWKEFPPMIERTAWTIATVKLV